MNSEKYNFELLCVDAKEISEITSVDKFTDLVKSYCEQLQKNISYDPLQPNKTEIDPNKKTFSDNKGLKISIALVDTSKSTDLAPQNAYIIKFFTMKLGAEWWKDATDTNTQTTADRHKDNESYFGSTIENEIYHIGFKQLENIIFNQYSKFIEKNEIINEIFLLPPSLEALNRLQKESGNYIHYFKEAFKDAEFQSKWRKLEKIRHRVAHNTFFGLSDQNNTLTYCSDLLQMIETADNKIDNLVLSKNEIKTFQNEIIEQDAFIGKLDTKYNVEINNWRDEVKLALKELNGQAELTKIYNYIKENTKRELPKSWMHIIRYTLQTNSADTKSFSGNDNCFKWIDKGIWGLRNYGNQNNSDNNNYPEDHPNNPE